MEVQMSWSMKYTYSLTLKSQHVTFVITMVYSSNDGLFLYQAAVYLIVAFNHSHICTSKRILSF